jgi:putative effector of murein hydrolase
MLMKGYKVNLLTIVIVIILYEGILNLIGLNYQWFSNDFNFLLLMLDMGIFIALFVPIYIVLRKVVSK